MSLERYLAMVPNVVAELLFQAPEKSQSLCSHVAESADNANFYKVASFSADGWTRGKSHSLRVFLVRPIKLHSWLVSYSEVIHF